LFLAKLLTAAALYAALAQVKNIDCLAVMEMIGKVGVSFVLIVVLDIACTSISALQWRLLALPLGVGVGAGRALRLTFMAVLATNFWPTSFGGDALKVALAPQDGYGRASAGVSALMQRLIGFTVLVAVAGVGATTAEFGDGFPTVMWWVLAGAVGVTLAAWALLLRGVTMPSFVSRLPMADRALRALERAMGIYGSHAGIVPSAFGLSCLFYAGGIFTNWVGLRVLGTPVPFSTLMALVPLIYLFTALPVTINGLGLREGAYVFLFTSVGVPKTAAMSLAVLLSLSYLMLSLFGCALLVGEKRISTAAR
jgi:hypothetical protein